MSRNSGILVIASEATEARNSRILVIASEAKQSLGILDFILGILDLPLGILDFCSLLGWINLAYKFYRGGALNP